jgi:ubiquinone/menaquinone biosynthesis C-methylase UbiE
MNAININQDRLMALVGMAIGEISGANGGVMISVGNKLGLYKAMAGRGPMFPADLAKRAGCAERYVREWLNCNAAGGYVAYHPETQQYELTPEQAMMLADDTSPVFIPNAWEVTASMWFDEAKTIEAFRTGKGIAWGDHHERLYCGVAAFFRNGYAASLVPDWLPALTGMVPKLEAGARVADIGCGHGHSTVLMAKAFPKSRFWGFDTHAGSIAEAREVAKREGVADRVSFEVVKAGAYPAQAGGYDLICFFDALHDMGFPEAAMQHAHKSLAPDGSVMLVEPFAHDKVEDNFNPVGRLYYAGSTMLCCAHAISENGTHVLGAQAGQGRLAEIAKASGFTQFRRATETPFNLVLEARR